MKGYIEHSYKNVHSIIYRFMQLEEGVNKKSIKNLELLHALPGIGSRLLTEEAKELDKILNYLSEKQRLTEEEKELMAEVIDAQIEINCAIEYVTGEDRLEAHNTMEYNLDYLKSLSDDLIFQSCFKTLKESIRDLYKSKFGTMPGTVIFHAAVGALYSLYAYANLDEKISAEEKVILSEIIFDIARNINSQACQYLIKRDNVFSMLK